MKLGTRGREEKERREGERGEEKERGERERGGGKEKEGRGG